MKENEYISRKIISSVLIFCLLIFQIRDLFSVSSDLLENSGNFGKIDFQYKKGFLLQGVNVKSGLATKFSLGKVDYTYYIGVDGQEIKLTDYVYDEFGRILKITDCTTGKYIQYGNIFDSKGNIVGWGSLKEYNADGFVISEYIYNDYSALIRKENYDMVDGKRTKTSEIFYEFGKPKEKKVYWEKVPDNSKKDDKEGKPNEIWINGSGRIAQSWEYGANGDVISVIATKIHVDEKNNRTFYTDKTSFDDEGNAVKIERDGKIVGTFEYKDGKLQKSYYIDYEGLTTTTFFDVLERPYYAKTRGGKTININFGSEFGERPINVNVTGESWWRYNDLSTVQITKLPNGQELKNRPGSLVSTKNFVNIYGKFKFSKRVGGIFGGRATIWGTIDVDTTTEEYYQDGDKKYFKKDIVDRSEFHSKVSGGFFGAIFGGLMAVVGVVMIWNPMGWAWLAGASGMITAISFIVGGIASTILSLVMGNQSNTQYGENKSTSESYNPANADYSEISIKPPVLPQNYDDLKKNKKTPGF